MKIRLKFIKSGTMKFVGHLDTMRYFQKSFRRCGIDIAYSQGFSPHQIFSFAAPLGIGLTSNGEYLDMELNSSDTSVEMIRRINAEMAEGIEIISCKSLLDDNRNAMSIVAGSDYMVSIKDGYRICDNFVEEFTKFIEQTDILITKKTKKSEKEVDIQSFIYCYDFNREAFGEKTGKPLGQLAADLYENGKVVYLQLATGSVNNLKPELVMEAFCNYIGVTYQMFAFQVHRIEVYAQAATSDEEDTGIRQLVALDDMGTVIN